MSRLPSRIALIVTLLLATLWWVTGPVYQAHAATDTVTDCSDTINYIPGSNPPVPTPGPGTLRYEVDNAAAGDTITFACSGTMVLGGLGVISLGQNLTIDGSGQAVTLDGGGINGGCALGLFGVENNASVILRNLTIANCYPGNGLGAVSVNPGSTLTVSNSTFSGNSDSSALGAGAIGNLGTLTVSNSTFSNNFGTHGGGIENSGTATVTNSTFSGNTAYYDGGGITNYSGDTLTVTNSTFSGNLAAHDPAGGGNGGNGGGGGIANSGTLTVTNSTFVSNSATDGVGGAIWNSNSAKVTNSTIVSNTAAYGASGIYSGNFTNGNDGLGGGGPTLANLILGGGGATGLGSGPVTECAGVPPIDNGGNFATDGSCAFTQSSSTNNATSLLTAPLADNGGPTQTLALLSGSVAIGAAKANCPSTDQRGAPRSTPCSSGAFEYGATVPPPDTDLSLTGMPANITTVAGSPNGAVVSYTSPTAVDEAGDRSGATVGCDHASGSTFPIGATTVTCTASDSDDSNSPVRAQFTVTVNSLPADGDLSLTGMPANITTVATSAAGAVVTYTDPSATDETGDSPAAAVSCDHASGATFPIGTRVVICTATDSDDTNSPYSAAFVVTVTNPLPTISGSSPATATAGSAGFPLTLTGTGFVPTSVVQLDGAALTTHYGSWTQLTADVPANLTAHTSLVTVVNPAPGGTSNPQVLYVTSTGASLTGPPSVATGANAGATTGGSGVGTPGSVSVRGLNGSGTVAVAQYGLNPAGSLAGGGGYFDVFVAPGSTFANVTIVDCNLAGGSSVQWWDGTSWGSPLDQTYNAATGCTTVYVDLISSPSIAQLGGTPFGVVNVPPVVTVPAAQSVQYGGQLSFQVSATDVVASDKLTLTAGGLPSGLSFTDNGNGTGTVSGTVTAPVGSYTASFTANDGHSDSPVGTVQITVTSAPLTITADNQQMTYGGSLPKLTWTANFVNGDTAASLATAPNCTTVAAGSPAGSDAITCSGAVDPNYSIGYLPGTLIIEQAPLTIIASSPSIVYGTTMPVITNITASYSSFVNGDSASSLTTVPSCSAAVPGSGAVGSYPTSCTGAVDPNYTISYLPGTLIITPAPLTITADNQQMTYGGTRPKLTWTANFVNGDNAQSLTTQPTCTTVTAISPAGSDDITCTGAADPNYTIGYAKGTLTINPAPLTITASSPTGTYNGSVPAITPGYGGFVNGDTAASLTTPPACTSTAPSNGAAGTYSTSCTGAADPNYSITYAPGTLTINPAPQAITFGTLANHLLGDAPFTVSATGGASGNPVTFTAGPGAVCTSSGTNGATITLVGVGACTVNASQAGNENYQAAPSVARSFTVAYPPLYLALSESSSPAGPVTTGSVVTLNSTLGNHTSVTQTVRGKVTLTDTTIYGPLSFSIPFTLKLKAGQTLSRSDRFKIQWWFPRGTYTLNTTAKDGSGDTASSSTTLTVS